MNKTDCFLWCLFGIIIGGLVGVYSTVKLEKSAIESAALTSGVYQLEYKAEGLSKAVYCKPVKVHARESKSYLDIYVESGEDDVLVTTVEVVK